MTRSDGHPTMETQSPEPPNLNYVPIRAESDSGMALSVALALLTLLVWMLSAR